MKFSKSKLVVFLIVTLSFLGSNAAWAGPQSVTVGTSHSLVVKSNGSAWGWGSNESGQLGNAQQGYLDPIFAPIQADISNILAIAAPCYTTHVLRTDGTVWSYGNDEFFGVLGNNRISAPYTNIPVQVLVAPNNTPLTNIIAIAAFGFHSMALKSDGTVWAWGQGAHGQLGDGTGSDRPTAVQVLTALNTPLTGVVAIAAGNNVSFAIKSNGTVWGWGRNNHLALGVSNSGSKGIASSSYAMKISGLRDVIAVAPGLFHTVALKSDGTVWTWGEDPDGQLGDGPGVSASRYTPAMISGISGVTKISTHWHHTLALKNDGTLWTWGPNWAGQLGDGTTTSRTSPGIVSSLTGVKEIAAGTEYSLVILQDERMFAWGSNQYGRLGDGTQINRLTPVQVQGITP